MPSAPPCLCGPLWRFWPSVPEGTGPAQPASRSAASISDRVRFIAILLSPFRTNSIIQYSVFYTPADDTKAKDLASRFVKNFVKYTGNDAGKALVAAGPKAE